MSQNSQAQCAGSELAPPSIVALRCGVVVLGYVLFSFLGRQLSEFEDDLAFVWITAGIGVGALYVWGLRYWPVLLLANVLSTLVSGMPTAAIPGLVIGGFLAPLAGAYFLRRTSHFDRAFQRRSSVLYFILVPGFACMLISATIAVFSLYVTGNLPAQAVPPVWIRFWIGNVLGVLILAPVFLTASQGGWREVHATTSPWELGGILIILVVASVFSFANPLALPTPPSIAFLTIPFLIWAAMRGGTFVLSVSVMTATSIALICTALDWGPIAMSGDVSEIATLITYVVCAMISGYMFVAMRSEQQDTLDRLREREARYRLLEENVRDIIWTATLDLELTYVSPSIRYMRGFSPEVSMAMGAEGAGPPSSLASLRAAASDLLEKASSASDGKDATSVQEVMLYRKDGTVFPAEMVVSLLYDNGGRPSGFLGITRDITERVEAARALKEGEALLRTTGQLAQVGGWEYDVRAARSWWTEEVLRLLDHPPDDTLSFARSIAYCHPDDRARLRAAIKLAVHDGTAFDLEHRAISHRGKGLRLRSICKPVREEGRTVRLRGAIQDITRQKEGDEHRRLLESVITHANDAVIIFGIGPDAGPYQIRFVNEAFTAMTGYAASEVEGQTGEIFLGPETSREEVERMAAAMEAFTPCSLEIITYRKDGTTFWSDLRVAPVKDEQGRWSYFIVVSRDVSERRRAEAEKLEAGARAAAVIENAVDGIITFDELGAIESVNPAAERLFGYSATEGLGMRITQLIPEMSADGPTGWGRSENDGGRDLRGKRKGGDSFPLKLGVGELVVGGQQVYTAIVHDLTHQRELENQLLQSQKMESLGTMASGIAHDFNNILQAIMGFNSVARECIGDVDTATLRSCLEEIDRGSLRAASLIEQILTFSRESEVIYGRLSLVPVVQDAISFLRGSLPATVRIESSLDEGPFTVWGESTQIFQVLNNLATNSFHSMANGGGSLRVELAPVLLDHEIETRAGTLNSGEYARLFVADSGSGIPSNILNRILDPFFTTKEKGKGTGLGLATVHGIVVRMGGGLLIDSEVGRGTTIEIYLPVLKDPAEIEAQAPAAMAAVVSRSASVLVLDDEEPVVSLLTLILEKKGFSVCGCTDTETALARFDAAPHTFDAAIVDYTMPNMTGVEIAAKFHQGNPDLPIFLVTGMMDQTLLNIPENSGIVEILGKPLRAEALFGALNRVLDKK